MNDTVAAKTLNIDGLEVPINGERNLLELIRKADIDLPTFCYHSDLSVYGACRLCLVDIAGRGIQGACSTPPEPGLKVRTQTEEIREIRKISIELLLANHERECTDLRQERGLPVAGRRPQARHPEGPLQARASSPRRWTAPRSSLVRDPNKCVLCGDCVRFCSEIQGIGAIDFAYRGHDAAVLPAFGKDLGEGECVNCGQCAAVCPTGALTPRSEIDEVWKALNDPAKTVVAQIAPAVRVAIGELFGMPAGESTRGQMVAALKRLGFDKVYDTSFSADLTVIEEANEFLKRKAKGEKLPLFTSCCPGWVKFAEQYFPELLPNLSTCKSPQQMLGALCKELLPAELGVKKRGPGDGFHHALHGQEVRGQAARVRRGRPAGGGPCAHHAGTGADDRGGRLALHQACSRNRSTCRWDSRPAPASSSAIRAASARPCCAMPSEKVTGRKLDNPGLPRRARRGRPAPRRRSPIDGIQLKLGSRSRAEERPDAGRKGRGAASADLDLIEVMACPGGCIGGAGQPVSREPDIRRLRTKGLYDVDKNLDLHKSQENHFVTECYQKHLGEIGGRNAHRLLHTHYQQPPPHRGRDDRCSATARRPRR